MDKNIIGKTVTVIVDRPLKTCHPNYPEIVYKVNYGYIKGIFAPDGEEQDAYILGVNMPVRRFTGKVIAIVRRINDIEDKLIVVPDNMTFSKQEIMEQISFQEKYFVSEIEM